MFIYQAWWHSLVIPAIQESEAKGWKFKAHLDYIREFKVSLGNLGRPCLKVKGGLGM